MPHTLRHILGSLYTLLARLSLSVRAYCGPGRGRRYRVSVAAAPVRPPAGLAGFARELQQEQADARRRAVRALAHLEQQLADQPGVALTVRLSGDRGILVHDVEACSPAFPKSTEAPTSRLVEVIAWFRNDC